MESPVLDSPLVSNENSFSADQKVLLKKAALLIRALNHRLRQQMYFLLLAEKSMTVTQIYVRLRMEQSVASQHLAILRKAGFVKTTREGKYIYYSADQQRTNEVLDFCKGVVRKD